MQNNVIDYLNEIVKTKPDKIAYANENEEYTFKEVLRYSRSIATFLAQKGIYHEKNRKSYWCGNCIKWSVSLSVSR